MMKLTFPPLGIAESRIDTVGIWYSFAFVWADVQVANERGALGTAICGVFGENNNIRAWVRGWSTGDGSEGS